jgi:hypothetical protein
MTKEQMLAAIEKFHPSIKKKIKQNLEPKRDKKGNPIPNNENEIHWKTKQHIIAQVFNSYFKILEAHTSKRISKVDSGLHKLLHILPHDLQYNLDEVLIYDRLESSVNYKAK